MGQVEKGEIEMTMPRVKVACVAAVMQKAMHSNTMGVWAIDWLKEFCEEQPALATHMCAWIDHYHCEEGDKLIEGMLTSMTAMIGIMVKSMESQIECDELIEELGV
jgi:hypothetical protein